LDISNSPDAKNIRQLVSRLESGASLSAEERKAMLATFERFECWGPYFRLIKRSLNDPRTRDLADFIQLARIQNVYLEDVFAAASTCTQMVENLGVTYATFREEVLSAVTEFEDFAAEATVLQAVAESFRDLDDRVACYERLCMLYEKKTHNETQLATCYERLLEIEPTNVKALRYFKFYYTQVSDWEEVVRFLKLLLDSVKHPQELYRVAQELSAIFLYQLDLPKEAIGVLETYCSESPLDASTILYDSYQRLGNWSGCLKVLRGSLLTVDADVERAILHHKMAVICEQIENPTEALENYKKSAELWTAFLDPVEGILNLALSRRDWVEVEKGLEQLAERVHNEELAAQLKQAIQRLQDGLRQAKSEGRT